MIATKTNTNPFAGTFAKPHKPTLKPSFAKEPSSQHTKTPQNGLTKPRQKRRAAPNT